jgi:hypothetical protein
MACDNKAINDLLTFAWYNRGINQSKKFVPPGDNPKYVVFSLFDSFDRAIGVEAQSKTRPDATIYYPEKGSASNTESYIIDKLREHIRKYGTIDELMISGHSGGIEMSSRLGDNGIDIKSLLERIGFLEEELGHKITNRIVFDGCSTFSELNNSQIKFYRDFADKHDMEIVGLTSFEFSGFAGRHIQFTPKGEVIRDKLDTKNNPIALVGDDRSWVDYHLGHTQEEAEKAIRQDIIKEATSLINFKNMPSSNDYEFNNDKLGVENNLSRELHKKDDLTGKTEVLLSKDEKSAVIISSDGMVRTRGNIKPHKLTDAERFASIEHVERFFDGPLPADVDLEDNTKEAIKDEERNPEYNPEGKHFSLIMLDNKKGILLATEDGGYEIIPVQIIAEPPHVPVHHNQAVPQNHKLAPKGRGK